LAPVPFIARAQSVNALAFDSAGDLWATEGAYGQPAGDIVEFTSASLAAATAQSPPAPALTIAESAAPLGLTFDARGNLWVAVGTNIDEFAGKPSSASATPIVQLTGAGDATAIAFAPDGTLWYSRGQGGTTSGGIETETAFGPNSATLFNIYGLSPAQIAQSGSPAPASMLSVPAPIPNNLGQTDITVSVDTEPLEIAFDANGNLWTEAFQSLPCSNQPGCGASAGTTSELIDFPAATLHTTGAARIWTSGGFFNPGGSTVLTNSASYDGKPLRRYSSVFKLQLRAPNLRLFRFWDRNTATVAIAGFSRWLHYDRPHVSLKNATVFHARYEPTDDVSFPAPP
jgi:hypothetical protein